MIDLTKKILPGAIYVDGVYIEIHTDFRRAIRFFEVAKTAGGDFFTRFGFLFEATELSKLRELRKIPGIEKKIFDELVAFFTKENELPRYESGGAKVIDYKLDADAIYASFYQQYKIDLLTAELHWYQFLALLQGLKNTQLNDIIAARLYKTVGDKSEYDKTMTQEKLAWTLPTEAKSAENDELDAVFI